MTCCHECRLELREGDQVRLVIEEHETSVYELPVHLDCRAALARECSALIGVLLVELMRRRKDFGSRSEGSLPATFPPSCRPNLSPAEAPEEPALFYARVAS